jgi:hypothetical protein
MARKRRKDGHRNGEEGITATKGVPKDTNVEVLPVRETEVEKTKSSQVRSRNISINDANFS